MSKKEFAVGDILINSLKQFTKIISIKNGIYGLAGWTTKDSAEKSTVATKFVNSYGLEYAGVEVFSTTTAKVAKASAPVASVASKAKVSAPKASGKPKAKGKGKK